MKIGKVTLVVSMLFSQMVFGANLLKNSSFEKPLSSVVPNNMGVVNTENSWIKYENSSGEGSVEIVNGDLIAISKNTKAPAYGLQVIQAPLKLEAGGIYKLKFKADTDKKTQLTVKIGSDGERSYYGYWEKEIVVSPNQKEYVFDFEMLAEEDEKARFEFWFTKTNEKIKMSEVSLEKIGTIDLNRMINLAKFQVQHKYTVTGKGENILTAKDIDFIKKLKSEKEFVKTMVLEEDSDYLVKISGNISADEKYLISIENGKTFELNRDNKECLLKNTGESTNTGKIIIKKIGNKQNLNEIRIEKYFGDLIWNEEFDYEGLPKDSDWGYDVGGNGWGNAELQYYTEKNPDNAYVEDGKLTITAWNEAYENNEYTSARLVTRGKKDFLYGRIEVKAKLPQGLGTWPAIWLMPTDSVYGDWPKSGEIDIMEHVGFDQNRIHGTVHTEKYYWKNSNQKSGQIEGEKVSDVFHTYSLEWTPKVIKVYFDNILYFTYQNENAGKDAWPFDQKFYLILNIAVGGAWGGQQGVDSEVFPQQFEIDSIKVYDLGFKGGKK
ncbi:family 16 glycosylhydrolase [Cetobacterium sp. ZOR0034]|uniref:family 16 glycosylhydrolase n=1 Tax=unclassified Cetobacterium TaxID=2630983 RepID=UPI0009E0B176|nr:family 16 glycosylhydrolase [Cetobacterium sp. ZOR0034]